jgi:hypothetical protein
MIATVPASRLRTTALAAVVTLALGIVTAISSTAGPAEAAQRCDGVWVVVDASVLDGPVTSRCAPGSPRDGLAALEAAGHRYSSVPRFPGMVCTIDGRPDPCNGAPTEAYWSYWHADPGGTWRYSNRGAGAHRSDPGTVEGWAFGAGQPPRTAPPSNPPEAEPSPSPTPTTEPTPSPSPSPTARPQADPTPTATDGAGSTAEPEASRTDDGGRAATEPDPTEAAAEAEAPEEAAADPAGDGTGDTEATPAAPPPSASTDLSPENPAEQGEQERPPVVLEERRPDDEVAIGAPGEGGAMAGLIAGSGLAAAIAGAGVFQARRRRREPNP